MQFDAAMLMALLAWEFPFPRPASVAIHDDGDVLRGGGVICVFRRRHARAISALDFHDGGFLGRSHLIDLAGVAVGDLLELILGPALVIL